MKIPEIRLYDDLDRAENDARTPAEHTRFLGYEGKWYELDLTTVHTLELETFLERYTKTGVAVSSPPKARPRKSQAHGGRRNAEYYQALIDWADENKITKKDGTGRPAYAGVREGRNDYPDWLIAEYDAHLAKTAAEPAA